MIIDVRLDELLDYSDHERAKWREWVEADPDRLAIPVQPGGRFPHLGSLLDHMFLSERRHLSRLEGAVPPDTTGVVMGDWTALFDYAAAGRAGLRRYLAGLGEERRTETLEVGVQTRTFTVTRRKLLLHIVVHEIRHLAQVALAARVAGHEPPGRHDVFYFTGMA